MNVERLAKLADFLDTVHPSKFDLDHWLGGSNPQKMAESPSEPGDCGTTACAVGWFPAIFPEDWQWENEDGWVHLSHCGSSKLVTYHLVADFLGISYDNAAWLFSENSYPPNFWNDPKAVASRIRELIQS